ncbi:MAG: serine hydrolase [Acutalibacteraceae bacterium]|nr:serine hydrolase [Acutalibacteraceae bacterium]
MKRILSILLLAVTAFTMFCTPVQAVENTTSSDIEFDNIDTKIENFAKENEGNYASFATAVFNGGEVLYSKHFGYIDRENQIVADENTVYEWGSISKTFIWISIMQLHEQGKIDLNADIRTYLPDGFLTKLKYDEPITMMNLMNHNAGWQETMSALEVTDEANIISLEEALKATEPMQAFKPGEITAYSNWGAALAGYIVERVSGMDYAEYLHKNILEPLNMEQTSVSSNYRDNEWVRKQREKTKAYLIMNYDGIVMDEDLGTAMSYILLYPAGSVTGTLKDITTFAQAFVSDNCPFFEKQETLDLMLSASDFYGDSDIPKNCHGLWVTEYAVSTMGHSGNTNGGSANLVFDKESKTGVVVLTNQQSEGVFCYGIPELIFGTIKENPIYTDAKITQRNDISGNYVLSRGFFEGVEKISACFNYLHLAQGENPDSYTVDGVPAITRLSDNLYMIDGSNDFLYETTTSDGRIILECSSMAYIQDNAVASESIMIIIFAGIAIITLVMLIVKGIKKLAKKYRSIPVGKAILAGQFARLAVGIVLIILFSLLIETKLLVVICIITGVSAIVCLFSAVFSVKALITEKEMKNFTRVRYVVSVLCNLFTVGFIMYFQLFNFWV